MNKQHKPAHKKMSVINRSYLIVSIALVLTLLIGIIAITGLPLDSRGLYKVKSWVPFVNASNWPTSVPLGLGIGGGTYAEFTATLPEGSIEDKDAALNTAVSILQNRLSQKKYLDSVVTKTAEGNIRVEIPNAPDSATVFGDLISSGNLIFSFPDGVFLEGNHVKSATVGTTVSGTQQVNTITVALDAKGTRALSDATTANASKVLTVAMDGATLLSTTIDEAIINGQITISGFSTLEDARNVAVLVLAAAIYFAARYLLGGLAFAWAMWIHIIFTYFLLAVFPNAQLNLLGLIGIALTFGLFVWAGALFVGKFALGLRPGRMHKVSLSEGWQTVRLKVWKTHGIIAACALVLIILPIGVLHSFAYAVFFGTVSSMVVILITLRALVYSFAHITKVKASLFGRIKNA